MYRGTQRGFTIIEMLIVLAIAGLILSMILVVIPTLQRNGRNNQRQQDVQAILANVSNYALNNSGNFPSSVSDIQNGLKLSHYEYSGIELKSLDPLVDYTSLQSVLTPLDLDRAAVVNRQKCDVDQSGRSTGVGAGYNDVVALYVTETGGGNTAQRCQEL